MKIKNLLIVSFFIISIIYSHKRCGTDSLPKKEPKFIDLYGEHKRFLQDIQWNPIRIYIDYTALNNQKLKSEITNETYDSVKRIITKSVEIYQKILKVKRSNSKLKSVPCGDKYSIDPNLEKDGVDADIIINPFIDTNSEANVEAYAIFCYLDSTTNRPVIGEIGFGKSLDFKKQNSFEYHVLLTLHEINHILCFHNDLAAYFIDENGNKRPDDYTIATISINGINKKVIKSPKVMEAAKKHFGCNDIKGLELENHGGEGTAGSHWEARLMLGDFMIGESYGENVISEITLALFEDSGWYKTNPYTGGLFKYGKNGGCDFLNLKCIKDGSTQFYNEFSIKDNPSPMCLAGRSGRGFSSLSKGNKPLPNEYRYWVDSNKGGYESADYCPVSWFKDEDNYYFGFSCTIGVKLYDGEIISPDSLCFISSLNIPGKTITERSICYNVECKSSTRVYLVTLQFDSKDYKIECPTAGAKLKIDGLNGEILCPDYNLMCTKSNSCKETIDCVDKMSLGLPSTYDYKLFGNYQFLNSINNTTQSTLIASSSNTYSNSSQTVTSSNTNSGTQNTYNKPVSSSYLILNYIILIGCIIL